MCQVAPAESLPRADSAAPPTGLSVWFAQLSRKPCGSLRAVPRSWRWRATARWRATPYSPKRSRGPTKIPTTMKKREPSFPPFMTSTERGSRSEFGEAGSNQLWKKTPGFRFCLLSRMFKRDNALLQGSWRQCFVTRFLETKLYCHWCLYHMVLEKKTNQPV